MKVVCDEADSECNVCDHIHPHERKQTGSEMCTDIGFCALKDVWTRCIPVVS